MREHYVQHTTGQIRAINRNWSYYVFVIMIFLWGACDSFVPRARRSGVTVTRVQKDYLALKRIRSRRAIIIWPDIGGSEETATDGKMFAGRVLLPETSMRRALTRRFLTRRAYNGASSFVFPLDAFPSSTISASPHRRSESSVAEPRPRCPACHWRLS